jgi:hypothetical protein
MRTTRIKTVGKELAVGREGPELQSDISESLPITGRNLCSTTSDEKYEA